MDSDLKRVFLILHSLEFLFIFWSLIYVLKLNEYWIAAAIGFTQHMFFDILTNYVGLKGYFLAYRMLVGFETKKIINFEAKKKGRRK